MVLKEILKLIVYTLKPRHGYKDIHKILWVSTSHIYLKDSYQ